MKTGRFVKVSIILLSVSLIMMPIFALTNLIPSVTAQGEDHPWPMFLQNPQLTSYSDGHAPGQPDILWNYTFGSYLSLSVAASYGKVFVACQDRNVYAINESSGQKIWNYTLPLLAISSPAAGDGKVFVSSADGNLYALDEATGSKVWNYTLGFSFITYMPAPTVADGMVFASSFDSKVYALNQTIGSKIWNFTTDSFIFGSISVSAETVFVKDLVNLYALSRDTGTKIWNYTTSGSVSLVSPVIADGKVLVVNGTNQLFAIDQLTGNKVWDFTAVDGQIVASPAVAYDKIFVNSANVTSSKVYALDMDGNQMWQSSTSGSTGFGSPAVADDMAFVVSSNATHASISTFNQSDGSEVWHYDSPLRNQFTSPIVAYGKLIVAFNSTLTAFGIHDLAIQSLDVPSTISLGDQVLINVTVKNTGDFSESSSMTVYVNETSIDTEPFSNLAPGATTMLTFSWNTAIFQAGNYNVTAVVATVPLERITTDNILTSLCFVGVHNLTVLSLTVPSSVNSGDHVLVNVTVQNTGNFAESTSVTVYVNDTGIGTEPVSSLAPGTVAIITVDWNTAGLQPGNSTITAFVQPVNQESTTSDNLFITSVTVNAAQGRIPPELLIAIVAAVVAIAAVIVAVALLRRRKPKKTEPPTPQTTESTQPGS